MGDNRQGVPGVHPAKSQLRQGKAWRGRPRDGAHTHAHMDPVRMRLEPRSLTAQSLSIAFFFSLDSFLSVHCKVGTEESYNMSMECPEKILHSVSQLFKVTNPLISLLKAIDSLKKNMCPKWSI